MDMKYEHFGSRLALGGFLTAVVLSLAACAWFVGWVDLCGGSWLLELVVVRQKEIEEEEEEKEKEIEF